jgi:hypothetical protein
VVEVNAVNPDQAARAAEVLAVHNPLRLEWNGAGQSFRSA